MPVKVPKNAIEMHQWINTVALAFIGFICSSIFLKIENDHDKILETNKIVYGHEIRIDKLEDRQPTRDGKISMLQSPAMLPENKFFTNEKIKQWNFSNK